MASATDNERTFEALRYSVEGSTVLLFLSRPQALNALNHQLLQELDEVLTIIGSDDRIRGVILSGGGERAFAAGADISEFAGASTESMQRRSAEGQALFERIETLGKPVIAAVNGLALGGGCELAMACTLRLASEAASFGQPEVKLGLIPGLGGTQRLPALVGRGAASHMILTGRLIGAAEALRLGLVDEVVPAERLLPRAREILDEIAAQPPLAVRFALQAIQGRVRASSHDGFALESALFALCATTEDMREGAAAFLEKRRPSFVGP